MKQEIKSKVVLILLLLGNVLLVSPAYAQWDVNRLTIFNLPGASIYDIIGNLLFWILAIVGFIAIIGFAISGIMYLTAAGDETRAEKAKKAMTYSIIGVIVGISGLVIVGAIDWALRGRAFF